MLENTPYAEEDNHGNLYLWPSLVLLPDNSWNET
jgi:hypothetical protein